MKWLLSLAFIAHVTIPTAVNKRYIVKEFEIIADCYRLTLVTGEAVYVPQTFTIIEEKRDK